MRHILLLVIAACALQGHIELLIPADTTAGAAGFTLRARGANYESGEYLLWNGTPLDTEFISEQELQAFVPARLLTTPGPVTVTLAGYNSVQFLINPPPVITTESPLPPGTPGVSYSKVIDRTGGSAPFRWDVASGEVPAGLAIDPVNGILTGTPRTAGTYGFVLRVTDRVGIAASKPFTLVIGQTAPAEPSCSLTPRNMLLPAHHPVYHSGQVFQVPDHVVRVLVTAGTAPVAGVIATLSATRPVFGAASTANATTDASGIATFTINPPAAEGFDSTDLSGSFARNGVTYRCSGSVLTGAGMLSAVRERLTAAAGAAMARLGGRFDADYREFADEMTEIAARHPELEGVLLETWEHFEPVLRAAINGQELRLGRGEYSRIVKALAMIQPHASQQLRAAMADWTRDIHRAQPKVKPLPPPMWQAPPFAVGRPPASGARRLTFEANAGQAGSEVRYVARGARHHAWFTGDGLILRQPFAEAVRMRFPGGRFSKAVPTEPAGSVTNYLVGKDRRAWRTGIPNYGRLEYPGVFPGVNLVFYGDEGHLRYDFVLAPRADPSRIAVAFEGVREVEPLASGELRLHYQGGVVELGVPYAYQQRGGRKQPVEARYRSRGGDRIGFELAGHDPSLPVVIDPVISYASLAGGPGEDGGLAVASGPDGSTYVAGFSGTTDVQAFVSRFTADGSGILYTTYFGGAGIDIATGVAVDAQGNAYLCGSTTSADFPAANGFQSRYGGGPVDLLGDGFLVKVDASGSSIVHASYLGGSGGDAARGIAVDAAGNAWITGFTTSSDFPVRNALQPAHRGGAYVRTDAFVVKANPAGDALVFSTFLGGSGDDSGMAIAVDAAGSAYVTGATQSADFPVVNPFQTSRKSESDAYVAKLSPSGNALVYSTYLGGASDDGGSAIAVDAAGSVYVAGVTGSADFPVRNAAQSRPGSPVGIGFDAFAAKLSPAGDSMVYGTFLGGSGVEMALGIAVDAGGAAYVVGETASSDFPVTNPLRLAGAGSDSFLTRIAPPGSSFDFSTYLGGQSLDSAAAVAVDAAGNVYVAGSTASSDPVATPGAASTNLAGRSDAFAIKISPGTTAPLVEAMPAARLSRGLPVAPESIVSLFGTNLAAVSEAAALPAETLGGVTVSVGNAGPALLYSVSPSRIDLVLPAGIAPGPATITVQWGGQTAASGSLRVFPVAPGIFTENGRGSGPPRGWAIRTEADGAGTVLPLGRCGGAADSECEALELELSGPVTLTLLASGVRGRSALEAVKAAAGEVEIPVVAVEPQGDYPGYDQIVLGPLPETLRGRGIMDLAVQVDGQEANRVRIRVR